MLYLLLLTLTSIAWAQINLAADPTNQISQNWIHGSKGVYNNDDETIIKCPAGSYVSDCFCADETTCDGVRILGNVGKCAAYHTKDVKQPTKPVVRCKPREGRTVKVVRSAGIELVNKVKCSPGFVMENCVILNPYSEYYNAHRVWSLNVAGEMTCTWKKGQNIGTTLRLNRPSYLSAVCVKYNI